MELKEYYDIIINKYSNGEYIIKTLIGDEPIIDEKYFSTYAHDYLIYEWMVDHNDDRWVNMINFVVIPNGVNQEGCDVNFNQINFEKFYEFLITLK